MKKIIWQNYDVEEKEIELNNDYFDDTLIELNIKLDGRILCIADMGLWNGKHKGYKIIDSRKISDILYSKCDYCEWYSDGHNIRSRQTHHDGTNLIEYREIREDRNIENLTDDIYHGRELSRQKINYYTKSIAPHVHKVYGW